MRPLQPFLPFDEIATTTATNVGAFSRRDGLVWGVATCALALASGSVNAQPVSAAAEEAKAPPLPVLGSVLNVPPIGLLAGGAFDPLASRGRALLVYWWSSTCPFCALQSPAMEVFWRAHHTGGLQMLALSIDKEPQDAKAYLAKKGYSFPAAWASPGWRNAYPNPKGLPITLLAGADGRLKVAERGQLFAEDIEAMAQFL